MTRTGNGCCVASLLSFLACMVLAGCSGSRKAEQHESSPSEENLTRIGKAYRDASATLKRGPANLGELKPYLKKYGDPDMVLRSPNDGQEYGIVWGQTPQHYKGGPKPCPVVAYEQQGAGGKRYVLDFMLKVKAMSDKEFAAVEFPQGQRPKSNG